MRQRYIKRRFGRRKPYREGDIEGNANAGTNLTCRGNINGEVSCHRNMTVEGNIN